MLAWLTWIFLTVPSVLAPVLARGLADVGMGGLPKDTNADATFTVLFLIALIVVVLFYHAPRRVARLCDYFAALDLPIVFRGRLGWWLEGLYRGVYVKVECGSEVRGSGPFALVATIVYSEDLLVDPAQLLPEGLTVFAHSRGSLCFRLPEDLYAGASAHEPLGLIDRLVDLDPLAVAGAAEKPTRDVFTSRPWHPLPLVLSLLAAATACYAAWAVSFFAAALVISAAALVAVPLSCRRSRPGNHLTVRAWAIQFALVMSLGILGVGLCFTRYGGLNLKDFQPSQIGNVAEIPHHDVRLTVTRQLETGRGEIGPGGAVYSNSLIWTVCNRAGKVLDSGRISLPLTDFPWISPTWDDGKKMFVLGVVQDYTGYSALALEPILLDAGGSDAAAATDTAYANWMVCKPAVPPDSPLGEILKNRVREDLQRKVSSERDAAHAP
ncbi:MAG: hypothetical protein ACREJ2_01280 [Planctomycetota bacterium]